MPEAQTLATAAPALPDHDGWRSLLAALERAEAAVAAHPTPTPTGGER
ncbi:hypothetical protein [Ornithinimicrobium tianjinense]|uniref:Uncharacterized protein n=1 Tax=Ornithinimicrobium tianjinense TaxID=1195761 RepID=A0A917BL58_9MICO|nr:hypothetical protein [Ornithinimicrobium tianjinense]GGF46535.1 hypothetical protein GCM10011366_12810 [Ornithinimicrobium tianjinense]